MLIELYLKTFKSLYNYYKYNCNYFDCRLCEFCKLTYYYYNYLINITYNYKIETDSIHKFNPF